MKRFALLALAALPFLNAAAASPESFSPTLTNLPASPQLKAAEWDRSSYAVHEWGTFTSVSGSDGKFYPVRQSAMDWRQKRTALLL